MDRYDKEGKITDLEHKEDHNFTWQLRQKHKKAEDTKEKVKASFISSILIAMTIGLAGFIWNIIMEILKVNK